MDALIQAIPIAATSPYALMAYLIAAVVFTVGGIRLRMARLLLEKIESVPRGERRRAMEISTGTVLPDSISPEQWIRNNRIRWKFLIAITTILVSAVVIVIALSRPRDSQDSVPSDAAIANAVNATTTELRKQGGAVVRAIEDAATVGLEAVSSEGSATRKEIKDATDSNRDALEQAEHQITRNAEENATEVGQTVVEAVAELSASLGAIRPDSGTPSGPNPQMSQGGAQHITSNPSDDSEESSDLDGPSEASSKLIGVAINSWTLHSPLGDPFRPIIGGAPLSCTGPNGPVATILDPSLSDVGRAIPHNRPPMIVLNPLVLQQLSPLMQIFWFGHECAHHLAGSNEMQADCMSIKMMRNQGFLGRHQIPELQAQIVNTPGSIWGHLPGPMRAGHFANCFDSP
jgi:hypothetical protein